MIEHKEHGNAIKVNFALNEDLVNTIKLSYTCHYIHRLDYIMSGQNYRRYRKGKNRCKRCGLKINADSKQNNK